MLYSYIGVYFFQFYHTQRKYEPKKYVAHKCGTKCIKNIKVSYNDLKGLPPLSIPLLCGWHRQLCKFPRTKKVILYQAPCGVRLRNMEELHRYLRTTGSALSVDLFDFDYWVRAFADFVVEKCFINIKVSQHRGIKFYSAAVRIITIALLFHRCLREYDVGSVKKFSSVFYLLQ